MQAEKAVTASLSAPALRPIAENLEREQVELPPSPAHLCALMDALGRS
jgi:hypothetical protein